MEAAFEETPFFDFGADTLYPFARTGLSQVEGDSPEQLRARVRQYCPREPGVYGMIDPLGRLVYVGKSKRLRNRLLSYFLPNNEEDKAGRIVQSTGSIVWETQPSEFAALLREQALIRHFQPRFNVQGMPRRQQPVYVCIGRLPAEHLYTARRPDPNASYVIGPLVGASKAARAVEVLNRLFLLRDCSSKQPCSFTDQLQLFDIEMRPGCIRLEIESCLGPCISACSRTDYERQVAIAKQFLAGQDDSALETLEKQMERASSNLHFEQAAVLREDIKAVSWLARRASDLARAREHFSFVYPVMSHEVDSTGASSGKRRKTICPLSVAESRQPVWYLIRRGLIEGAVAGPRNADQARSLRRLVKQWWREDKQVGSQFAPRQETLALVSSWFRNQRGELHKTFLPDQIALRSGPKRRSSQTAAVKV